MSSTGNQGSNIHPVMAMKDLGVLSALTCQGKNHYFQELTLSVPITASSYRGALISLTFKVYYAILCIIHEYASLHSNQVIDDLANVVPSHHQKRALWPFIQNFVPTKISHYTVLRGVEGAEGSVDHAHFPSSLLPSSSPSNLLVPLEAPLQSNWEV